MFAKILIANRGEIASRVIRTARAMGIATVAVYSRADRNALHVRSADEAAPLDSAGRGYLDIEEIVSAAVKSGADAVHPGYGFLSENAAFARALDRAGVVFIGPNPRAIEAMGDKIAAKALARTAGVAMVPGSIGLVDVAEAARIAAEIGYPVMVKATAGGGGKGLRLAASERDLPDAVARAKSEALSSFGDARVFIEKAISDPRHIEIQVLGDRHGALIHLGERECSIQRRAQKMIEEAPSPFLDAATRQAMGEKAVALARAVDYDSAGTVEFLVDRDRNCFFLEMNTRLQVEHPVTELVTGVDLVEQMIRVAAGDPLAIRQSDVHVRGWAVETRICAEDAERGFLPSTGRLSIYRPPPQGAADGAVRIDTGVFAGADIPIQYDPMIAKLIAHAGDRASAIEAQAQALDRFAIGGVASNILFLGAVMAHPCWRRGELSTGFIAQEFPAGFAPRPPAGELALRLAVVAAAMDQRMDARRRLISGQRRPPQLDSAPRGRSVVLGRERHDLRIEARDGNLVVRFEASGDVRRCASDWRPGEPVWDGSIDGESVAVQVRPILNGNFLTHRGAATEAYVYSRREAALAARMPERTTAGASKALLCPMPALLKAIHVAEGESVTAGQALCVIEAMKMETVLCAEADAAIGTITAREGDQLARDAAILRFV